MNDLCFNLGLPLSGRDFFLGSGLGCFLFMRAVGHQECEWIRGFSLVLVGILDIC